MTDDVTFLSREDLIDCVAKLRNRLNEISGVTREQLAERKFKEGFDAGMVYQRKANPPPKARDLAKRLDEGRAACRALLDSLSSDSVPVRLAAQSRAEAFVRGES